MAKHLRFPRSDRRGRRLALVAGVVLATLGGCAGAQREITDTGGYGGRELMAPGAGMVRLDAPFADARLLDRREIRGGMLIEEVVLRNATTLAGENLLRAKTRWRGASAGGWTPGEMRSPYTDKAVRKRFAAEFGMDVGDQVPGHGENRYGTYLYLVADRGADGSCVLAWQMAARPTDLKGTVRDVAIDFRFCGREPEPETLLAMFDTLELAPRL